MNVQSNIEVKGRVAVTDWSMWIKHVSGDRRLAATLDALRQGDLIELTVGGRTGLWEKKADGSDGRPTSGLKPIGPMKDIWFDWFRNSRGELVEIYLSESVGEMAKTVRRERTAISTAPALTGSDAAWAAFSALRQSGWQFRPVEREDRGDWHDRRPV